MKYKFLFIVLISLIAVPAYSQNFVNAKFGGDFLSVGAGARALGMGSAYSAIAADVTAAYWNPAGLADVESIDIAYMHSERFAGVVSYDYGAVALPLRTGDAVLAISFFRQGVDNIKNTLNAFDKERNLPRENAEAFFEEFSVADLAFFLTYAKRINERLSWGASAKVVNHSIGPFADAWGYSLDIAARYKIGKTFVALNAIDVTTMMKFWTVNESAFGDFEETFQDEIPSGQNERVLPTVRLGAGRFFNFGDVVLTTAADVDIRFENRRAFFLNTGKISYEPHFGIEGTYKERVSLRFGLTDFTTDPDNNLFLSPTLGTGFQFHKIFIDYGFTNFSGSSEVLGLTHRISLRLTL
ncbi:MAG: PorV/PorQ family protein [Balneolaceae bacterium]